MRYALFFLAFALAGFLGACDSNDTDDLKAAAVETYADIVYASYQDAYDAAVEMDAAIDAFIATPTEATLATARQAWLDAREPYGQTEAYRFSNGPIDDADGPEGLLNAWPMDESYVDYVMGESGIVSTGIINSDAPAYATIDADLLEGLNEEGGEENVSVGYHAIEFLLWGQDLSETGPGNRPVTDYTTAPNADRRAQYLATVSDLLLVHLGEMVAEWAPGQSGNYRATFLAQDADQALADVFTGIGTLAKSELAVERMFVAVNNQDQEDEHSCFSDNTHRDIVTNAQGIANVWRGSYTRTDGSTVSGTSLADVVAEENAEFAAEVNGYTSTVLTAVNAIPDPFDRAIINEQTVVLEAVDALQDLGDAFVVAAAEIGLTINNELPD
ncbi:MAG TPA: iron-regulated protein [Bacteroidetes bacterium]|nr:iron-regulated protein [Bacteroidota bacterium]HIL58378.1 iron-regulated protein [Rhodothermales bacterium]